MTDLNLCYTPAVELAARIRAGTLSPVTVIDNALDRIAAVNAKLNCFCFVYPEEARALAQAMEAEAKAGKFRGPLHGVPFAIKDLTPTKGKRTTLGSYAYEEWVPDEDATIVTALKNADNSRFAIVIRSSVVSGVPVSLITTGSFLGLRG